MTISRAGGRPGAPGEEGRQLEGEGDRGPGFLEAVKAGVAGLDHGHQARSQAAGCLARAGQPLGHGFSRPPTRRRR
jgi:hypothetical protein